MRVAIGFAFVLPAAVGLASQQASAAGPSFDCAKAGNWAEKEICKSDKLAALDAWFGPLYGQVAKRLAGEDLDALKARRKAWLKSRNDCKAEAAGTACLKTRYQEFTVDLERQFAQLVGGGSGAKGAGAMAAKSPLAECADKADAPGCIEELMETEEATSRMPRPRPATSRRNAIRPTRTPISATASPKPTSPGAPIATPNANAASKRAAAMPM